ncbi:DUF3054 domain-containing protein [Mycolicibacter terrae]|uniref:Transmembrane protein n=2 Tax=Mycolicibacter TaxID=1073531 RepID=A0A1A2Y3P2_MYCSD|nr:MULTISPECIES: DUF3054 domain-containing protein [Mycolicibacter]OBH19684.1 hypothetical protein A5694_18100 [Mycolicibacter sinensis]OBI32033.1 hypothetical protein A5710_16255 [Mycolicibacter sinensis]RRR41655.1 DUF3054 domain-containing protein [Mycolicibacter terrae]
MQPQRTPAWLGVDLVAVLIFCALGRRSHDEGITLAGLAATAWPFLSGTILGWLLSRGWLRPTALVPTGVIVWISTVLIGMALRAATAAGVAWTFVLVASTVTAVFLLGWRAVFALVARRAATGRE